MVVAAIKKINLSSSDLKRQKNIISKLNLKKQDKTDYNKLIQSINNLYATGNFENIQYKILDDIENDKGSILSLKVKEHRISNYLQLGVHFDDLYKTGIAVKKAKRVLSDRDFLNQGKKSFSQIRRSQLSEWRKNRNGSAFRK